MKLKKIKFINADAGSSGSYSDLGIQYTHIYSCNIAFSREQKPIVA